MTPSPSLAAPLGRALRPDFGDDLTEYGLAWAVKPILAALRADPDVLTAMAEALHDCEFPGYRFADQDEAVRESWITSRHVERLVDALFGSLGAGPIASGEAR